MLSKYTVRTNILTILDRKVVLSNISVVTWYSSGSCSDVKGRGLEGINDVVFCDAGQVIVVEKRALETSSVNFSQNHLKEVKETRADLLVKMLFKICIPKIIEGEILQPILNNGFSQYFESPANSYFLWDITGATKSNAHVFKLRKRHYQ